MIVGGALALTAGACVVAQVALAPAAFAASSHATAITGGTTRLPQ